MMMLVEGYPVFDTRWQGGQLSIAPFFRLPGGSRIDPAPFSEEGGKKKIVPDSLAREEG